jgi:TRAP-type C4-dicarboxylate transport system substrate-binding protein
MDGQENPTPTAVSAKLYEVQKYLSLSSHIYSAGMFVISPDVWAEVKDADKPAFIAAAKAGGKAMREFVKKAEAEAQATLRAKGVAINDISNRDAFVKAVEPVYASLDPALAAYVKRIRAVK